MNYRNAIREELLGFYHSMGPNNFVFANTLKSFSPGNQDFLRALNQLLAEGEILGVSTPDQQMAVCFNPERIPMRENTGSATNYNINISHSQGPINLFSHLYDVAQTLVIGSDKPNPKLEKISDLLLELQKALQQLPADKTEDGDRVVEQAEAIAKEIKRSHPKESLLQNHGQGLLDAANAVAKVVPTALQIAEQIVKAMLP